MSPQIINKTFPISNIAQYFVPFPIINSGFLNMISAVSKIKRINLIILYESGKKRVINVKDTKTDLIIICKAELLVALCSN